MQFELGTWVRIDEPANNDNTPEKTNPDRIYQIQLISPRYRLIAVPRDGDWELIPFDRLTEIPSPLTPYWRFSRSGRYLEVKGDRDITQKCDRLRLSEQIELAQKRVGEIKKAIDRQYNIISKSGQNLFAIDNAKKAIEEMHKDRDREKALLEQLNSYPVVSPTAGEEFEKWVKSPTGQNRMREATKHLHPNPGPQSLHPNSGPQTLHPNSVREQEKNLHPNSVRVQEEGLHPNSVRVQEESLHPNSGPQTLHPNTRDSVREQEETLHPNTTDSVRVQEESLHPNSRSASLHPNSVRVQEGSLHPNSVRVQEESLHPNIEAGLGSKHLNQKQIEKVKKFLRQRGYDVEEVLCTDKANVKERAEGDSKKVLGWKDWKEIKGKGPYAYYRCRVPGKRSPLSIYLGK